MVQDRHRALAREAILAALTAYTGITTADGALDGSTLVDSNLIGANDFISSKTVLIGSGDCYREDRGVSVFDNTTGTITVISTFNGQILSGTLFRILNLSSVETEIATILALLLGIAGSTDAILVLEETGGTVTATGLGTEDDIYVNDNPAGEYEPRIVVIDLSDLAGGEAATIREYYRIKSGGTARLKDELTFNGVQSEPMKNVELEPNRFGVAVTIEATIGVVIDWEVHFEV